MPMKKDPDQDWTTRGRHLYGLWSGSLGCLLPFLPILLMRPNTTQADSPNTQTHAVSASELGLVAGLVPLATILTAVPSAKLADRLHAHRSIFAFACVFAALARLGLLQSLTNTTTTNTHESESESESESLLQPKYLWLQVAALFQAPSAVLIDHLVLEGVGGTGYGPVRVAGSVCFGLAALMIGACISLDRPMLLWLAHLVPLCGCLWTLRTLPKPPATDSNKVEGAHRSEYTSSRLGTAEWRHVILLSLVAWCGFVQAGVETFGLVYLNDIGLGQTWLGAVLTAACLGEVPAFLWAGRIIRLGGHFRLVAVALAAYVVRLLAFAWVPHSQVGPFVLLLAQPLHGVTFALLWATAMDYAHTVALHSNHRLSSAFVGVLNAAFWGVGGATGNILCGVMYDEIGPSQMYHHLACASLLLLVLLLVWIRQTNTVPLSPSHK